MNGQKRGQIRQGDVFLVPVDSIPEGAKPVKPEHGRLILAHGEATGHHHSFAVGGGVTVLEKDGELFVDGRGSLEHQEHTAHEVVGPYKVIRQREYDQIEGFRQVMD